MRNPDPRPATPRTLSAPATGARPAFTVAVQLLFLLLYVGLDVATNHLELWPGVTLWYPPAGVGLALLLSCGVRHAPVLFLGALLVSLWPERFAIPLWELALVALVKTAVYGAAAWLLLRWVRVDARLRSVRDLTWLVGAGTVAAFAVAVAGALHAVHRGNVPAAERVQATLGYWVGDLIGILVFAPLLLVNFAPRIRRYLAGVARPPSSRRPLRRTDASEVLLQALFIVAISVFWFRIHDVQRFHGYYLFLLPLIWIALRWGLPGSVWGVFGSVVAVLFTNMLWGAPGVSLLEMQVFLLVLSLTGLFLGAIASEQRRAEQELRTSSERYRMLVETAHAIPWEADPESWHFTFVGPRAEHILGFPRDAWYQRGFWLEQIHPEDRDRAAAYRREQSAAEGNFSFEYRMVAADGRTVWIEDFASAEPGPEGRPRLRGYMFDITQRKQSEIALRESEELFRSLAESMAAATYIYQGDRFVYVNAAMEHYTGYTANQLLNMDFWPLLHPDDHEVVRQRMEARARGEAVEKRLEIRVLPRSGEVLWVDLSPTMIQYRGAKAILGTAWDVTSRKRAEQALRRNEEHFRNLIEHVSDIVHLMDDEGRIRYITPSVERILGFTPEEVLGMDAAAFVHPDDRPWVRQALVQGLQRPGLTPRLEMRLQHKDGGWRTVEVLGYTTSRNDGRPRLITTSHDVTERKRLEEQLLHAQKMEAIGRLAGGVAHDFNNLLTAIKGYSELLLADVPEQSEWHDDLELIRSAADRATSLARQLLAFSRRQVLHPRVLRLNELITDVERMLRRMIGEDIELHTELGADLPAVRVDPLQLEQVVLNLVVNARDAMPRGGKLTLRTSMVELSAAAAEAHPDAAAGRYLCVRVEDTGEGMDEATLARIFEPFFTTKEVGKGTGLGLSTAYGIVRQSGGFILTESTPGRGTAFGIFLPPAPVNAELADLSRSPHAAATLSGGTETVLIAEDEAGVRLLTRRVLEQAGYQVLEAEDGSEALQLFQTYSNVDLLLTDLVMPGFGGRELYAICRAIRPNLRVLYISGYADDPRQDPGAPDQHIPLLHKPFSPNALLHCVRQALDTARHTTPER